MDNTCNSDEYMCIVFKFGGYWKKVASHGRIKYEGGKQKTVKLKKTLVSLEMLYNEIKIICPWLERLEFELHYRIYGSSSKEYTFIISEIEVIDMTTLCLESSRIEIVVIIKEDRERVVCADVQQMTDRRMILDSNSYMDNMEIDTSKELLVGARYPDVVTFKNALRTNSILNNFGVKIQHSNKTRVIAVCSYRDCPWRVRATLCKDDHSFEIRKLERTHLCPGVNRAGNKQATISWVAEKVTDIVRKNPEIPPKQLNNNLESMYGLSLPYMKLWRSREVARENVFGSIDDNYQWVPAFQAELLKRNPGSHIFYSCSANGVSFERFFISFKVSIDGFIVGCRHLIGLDACHLKSKYLGVLLSANTLDGNNGLYTLAFAVAESESKKSWLWFLQNLAVSIGIHLDNLAFISDMEKGLAEAIKIVFPESEHRICVRHLWKNLKKSFIRQDNQKVGSLVWGAANALTETEYISKMNELSQISPQLYSYLTALPYKWARSTFNTEVKNYYNNNNMSESFNAWIVEARSKPVVDLLNMIRSKLMEQRAERKITSSAWGSVLVPYAEDYIRDITTRKEHLVVKRSTNNLADVEGKLTMYEVDLENRKCGCKSWQLTGLPCIHAVAFIATTDFPIWHMYVDECYYVFRYRMAYEGPISTLSGKDQWGVIENVYVGVPKTLRPRGRPKKRRLKNFLENSKISHKCSRCGLFGHHKTSCKNPLTTEYLFQGNSANQEKLPIRRAEDDIN